MIESVEVEQTAESIIQGELNHLGLKVKDVAHSDSGMRIRAQHPNHQGLLVMYVPWSHIGLLASEQFKSMLDHKRNPDTLHCNKEIKAVWIGENQ